jgi:transposase
MQSSVTFPAGDAGTETDEVELVRRAAVDAAATAALYQRYVARVYRFLRVRCGSPDEAADLTQQVFLKMAEALPRYRERGVPSRRGSSASRVTPRSIARGGTG